MDATVLCERIRFLAGQSLRQQLRARRGKLHVEFTKDSLCGIFGADVERFRRLEAICVQYFLASAGTEERRTLARDHERLLQKICIYVLRLQGRRDPAAL